jgi:hypothetical protein
MECGACSAAFTIYTLLQNDPISARPTLRPAEGELAQEWEEFGI